MGKNNGNMEKKRVLKWILSYVIVSLCLLLLIFISVNVGTIHVGMRQLFQGLFVAYDADVSTICDLRFPRIIISVLAGASIAVSGVLFQAVLKNPLADPGIIGVSSGAGFAAVLGLLITTVFPAFYHVNTLFTCLGGVAAFVLVYTLSWKGGLSPLRILLVGIAVNSVFSCFSSALNTIGGGSMEGVATIVNGNITMKTWEDVKLLLPYAVAGMSAALILAKSCNLLELEDRTAKSIGVDVDRLRLIVSFVAVLLASISTAVVGTISFLGLIVPHIGRLLVGSDHRRLIPYVILFGACLFLFADTVGRTVATPYEIPAAVIMGIVGGPFFIILLRKAKK